MVIISYTLTLESLLYNSYMAELLGVDITIGGLWHAGSYDPKILGRLIGDKPWVRHAEQSNVRML